MCHSNNLYCCQTLRCETNALDMTGMPYAKVLHEIFVRIKTDRADYLAGEPLIISGYKYRPDRGLALHQFPIYYYSSKTWSLHEMLSDSRLNSAMMKQPQIQS